MQLSRETHQQRTMELWLLLAIFLRPVPAYTINDCPPSIPRDQYLQLHGDSCFEFVVFNKKEYQPASSYCKSQGGTLALVKSQAMQDYLYGEIKNTYGLAKDSSYIWIGLNDIAEDGKFTWEDGSALDYAHWPNIGLIHYYGHTADVDDCVAINSITGHWDDLHCHDPPFDNIYNANHYYICQYQLGKTGPTTTTTSTTTTPTTTTTSKPTIIITAITTPTTTTTTPTTTTPTTTTTTTATTTPTTITTTPTTTTPTTTITTTATTTPITTTITTTPKTSTTATTTTSTTRSTTTSTSMPTLCPPFQCSLDCGMNLFRQDPVTGCYLCQCG